MKLVRFHPKARASMREFPPAVRREFGKAIFDLQNGVKLGMPISKYLPSVGSGVEELRIRDQSGAYRVFYYTRTADEILVFHAFQKKTQKTRNTDIEIGKRRLEELIGEKA